MENVLNTTRELVSQVQEIDDEVGKRELQLILKQLEAAVAKCAQSNNKEEANSSGFTDANTNQSANTSQNANTSQSVNTSQSESRVIDRDIGSSTQTRPRKGKAASW